MNDNNGVNLRDARAVIDLFERAAGASQGSPVRDRSIVRLPARGRLLATGDIHDNPINLQKIIRLARLEHSPEHHVVLHEMIHGERLINGLDLSHRILARVAELVLQFPGQVHPLLANHELAQMTGKGVTKGAGNSVELFSDGLEYVFGEDSFEVAGAINAFIAAMPLALLSEDAAASGGFSGGGVMCAHSLPSARMMKHFDLGIIRRQLKPEDYAAPFGSAHLMVWGRQQTAEQIEDLARQWSVGLFCLGHQHVESGINIVPPRLILLNSDHDRGQVLPLDLANLPMIDEALLHAVPLGSVPQES